MTNKETRELAEEIFEYLRRKGFSGCWGVSLKRIPDPDKMMLIEDLIKIIRGERDL